MSFEIVEPTGSGLVPSRFRKFNVDRFAPILRQVVEGQTVVKFKPSKYSLNANTAMCRVRDAALAIIRGIAFHEDVDADKLKEVWHLYKVQYDPLTGEIKVYQYQAPDLPSGNFLDATITVGEVTFLADLKAFATLYGHYRIRGRLTIKGMFDQSLKDQLTRDYNVFISQTAPNEHILT